MDMDTQQIIKTRDDSQPVRLSCTTAESPTTSAFKLACDAVCTWATDDETFGSTTLRPRIEPWLTSLVQSEHLSLLVGSGLTHATHYIATSRLAGGMNSISLGSCDEMIASEAKRVAEATGRQCGNFEDRLSVANDLLRGLEILTVNQHGRADLLELLDDLSVSIKTALQSFTDKILAAEDGVISSERRDEAFSYLINFLMSFSSRSGTRERLNLFTTNYDRFIEAGADITGLHLIDRFTGTLAPIFRASRLNVDLHYDPPGIRGEPRYLEGVARFTKLHGSIDWVDHDRAIRRIGLPFGTKTLDPFLNADIRSLMIYPNAAKDRETAAYPYVELFRDFATTICRPNSTLICYGYGFGDDHINRVIEDMLTIPSTHLVMIAYDDPLGRALDMYSNLGRPAQVTLLIGNHLGDLRTLVDQYLPKPAIDRTTYRMAELLKARWSTVQSDNDVGRRPESNEDVSAS